MRRCLAVCVLTGVIAVGSVSAKTPAALKSDLAGILPAGKKARLAWSAGGTISDYRSGTKIKVTDSDDGVIRELAPGTTGRTFGDLYHPHITYDGSRVIFTDQSSMSLWVINWDGTGLRQIGGGYGSDYYYDAATQTDWVVRNDGKSFTSNLKRINIDNTTQSVAVWTNPGQILGDADDGIGLSSDGLYVCSYWNTNEGAPEYGPCAILISSRARTCAADYPGNRGCVLSMAPDNHDFMHQSGGHITVQGYSGTNGAKLFDTDITTPIITWATQNGKRNACSNTAEIHDATRWSSSDRNYVTSMMQFTTVNPFVIRLSPLTFIYIQDSTNCQTASDMDLRIATSWKGSTSAVNHIRQGVLARAGSVSTHVFGIDGKRIVAGKRNAHGATIKMVPRSQGGHLRVQVE